MYNAVSEYRRDLLGKVISLEYGLSLPKSSRRSGSCPVVGSNGILGHHSESAVDGPGIVIGRKGSIGEVTWVDANFWPIDTTYYVKTKSAHDLRWVYHLLKYLNLKRLNRATGVPGLNRQDIAALSVPVPSVPQSKSISHVLGSIIHCLHTTSNALDEIRSLRQSLLGSFFSLGVSPKSNVWVPDTSGNQPIGLARMVPLANICSLSADGPFGSNLKTEHYVENGVRVIRLQNIGIGDFNDADKAYISEAHGRSLEKYRVSPGDLLVASMGDDTWPAGRACTVPHGLGAAIHKADCFRFCLKSDVADTNYVKWFLNSPSAMRPISQGAHGQTRLRLNLSNAKKIMVPCPPLDDQKRIGAALEAVHGYELAERARITGLKRLETTLAHLLLAGRISVHTLQRVGQ